MQNKIIALGMAGIAAAAVAPQYEASSAAATTTYACNVCIQSRFDLLKTLLISSLASAQLP